MVYCSISNFEAYGNYKAFWCYSNDNGNKNQNATLGSTYSAGTYIVNTDVLRVRRGPGTNYNIVTRIYRESRQEIDYAIGDWGHLKNGLGWICLDYCIKAEGAASTSQGNNYTVGAYFIDTAVLRVRSGAGTNYKIITNVYYGSLQGIDQVFGNWGHLSNNIGWICLNYCVKIDTENSGTYQVTTAALRIRAGAGTNYRIYGMLYKGSIRNIDFTFGNWGHLSNNRGWICLEYCKKIN